MKFATECAGPAPIPNTAWPTPQHSKDAIAFIPNVQGIPILPQLGMKPLATVRTICICGGQPVPAQKAGRPFQRQHLEKTHASYTYADSITWTKGKHTFKGGGEVRFGSSRYGDDVDGGNWSAFARAFGGDSPLSPTQNIDSRPYAWTAGHVHDRRQLGDAQPVVAPLRFLEPGDRNELARFRHRQASSATTGRRSREFAN